MSDESTFDLVRLRGVVLGIASVWMTVDDVQRELTNASERSGEKPAHVPIQVVQQLLSQLVEQGSVADRKVPGQPVAYRINRLALVGRRAKIVEALCFETDNADIESKLIERTGSSQADVDELVAQGLVTRRTSEFGALLMLSSKTSIEVIECGAEAVVSALIPHDADDREVGEEFARKAVQKAIEAEERAKKAESAFTRLRLWLSSHGVKDVSGIIDPPPPARKRELIDFTETRKIDDAEKGRILVEVLKLEEAKAIVQLRLDGAKSQGKADIEKIDAEIAALKSSAQSSERVLSVPAYKEIDWAGGATIVRAADDDRELKREPIPKGAQKPLDAVAVAETEPAPAAAEAPTDERPTLTDMAAAVRQVLFGAGRPLSADDIAAAIRETYQDVSEGLEGLLKIQLHQLARAKVLTRDKKTGELSLVVVEATTPVEESAPESSEVAGGSDEPGPLADPDRRRRGKRGAAGAHDEVSP